MTARAPLGLRPSVLVALFYGTIVLTLLATHAWDPLFFATVGPQWQRHDPELRKHADGTIFHDFATDPAGAIGRHARVRTARILYPLVARAVALGQADWIGWSLLLVNVAAIVLGTEIMHRLLERRGMPPPAALGYGLWCGLGLALLHGTAEPVAYLAGLAGIAAQEHDRPVLAGAAFLAALLTRETALLFVGPFLLLGRPRDAAGRGWWAVPVVVLAAWGGWLATVLAVGQGSTGPWASMARPPLSGYLTTRLADLPATVVFILVPAVLVLGGTARALGRRPAEPALWAALLNALLALGLPPKTAELLWHSGRLATGLAAAALLAASLALPHPGVRRGLPVLLAMSALWTAAVTVRYLVWDLAPW